MSPSRIRAERQRTAAAATSFETSMPLTLNDDLAYVDGLEAVTIWQPGDESGTVVAQALRRRVHHGAFVRRDGTREAAPSGGTYTESDVRWFLPVSAYPSQPRVGGKIVDVSGTEWTVLMSDRTALGTRWMTWCRSLALRHSLTQYIHVERATWSKGPGGALRLSWQSTHRHVRARVQPWTLESRAAHEQRFMQGTHRVYVVEPLLLDADCRLRMEGDESQVFLVRGCRLLDRIEQLLEIDVEQAPWPLATAQERQP